MSLYKIYIHSEVSDGSVSLISFSQKDFEEEFDCRILIENAERYIEFPSFDQNPMVSIPDDDDDDDGIKYSISMSLINCVNNKSISICDEESLISICVECCDSNHDFRKSTSSKHMNYLIHHLFPSETNPNHLQDSLETVSELLLQFSDFNQEYYSGKFKCPQHHDTHESTQEPPECLNGHHSLSSQLFPHQCHVITWMRSRESSNKPSNEFCSLWRLLKVEKQNHLYYQPYLARFSQEPSRLDLLPFGGMLCDEMGLGKTLDVISLILLNMFESRVKPENFILSQTHSFFGLYDEKSKSEECYICKHTIHTRKNMENRKILCLSCGLYFHSICVGLNEIHLQFLSSHKEFQQCSQCLKQIESRINIQTTLIVVPVSLLKQWQSEFDKHVLPGALNVQVFTTSKKHWTHPISFSFSDVLLCSYSSILREYNSFNLVSKTTRSTSKYQYHQSPLSMVNFWRVVFDEAQMAENTNSKLFDICAQLSAVNRWCVTGTPFKNKVSDLYGLCSLINYSPYLYRSYWSQLMDNFLRNSNFNQFFDRFKDILWIRRFIHVSNSVSRKKTSALTIHVEFDPTELHLYLTQREKCKSLVNSNFPTRKNILRLGRITQKIKNIMGCFLNLRKVCSIPFLAEIVNNSYNINKYFKLYDLLDMLLETTRLQCEEDHRGYIMNINGLSALYLIEERHHEALKLYEEAVQSWRNHKEYFRTDPLQCIHVIHNLVETKQKMLMMNEELDFQPDIESYSAEKEHLIKQYLQYRNESLMTLQKKFREKIYDPSTIMKLKSCTSHSEIIQNIINSMSPTHQNMLQSIYTEEILKYEAFGLSKASMQNQLSSKCANVLGIAKHFIDCIESLSQAITRMSVMSLESMTTKARTCCLMDSQLQMNTTEKRKKRQASSDCQLCITQNCLDELRSMLKISTASEEDNLISSKTIGGCAEIQLSTVLKSLKTFIRDSSHKTSLGEECEEIKFMEDIIGLVYEIYNLSKHVWEANYNLIVACDEIHMSCSRLRLSEDINSSGISSGFIHRDMISQSSIQFQADKMNCYSTLQCHLHHLKYLRNLKKVYSSEETENNDPCLICHSPLGSIWMIFPCAHSMCLSCYNRWAVIKQSANLSCHVCRTSFSPAETFRVSLKDGNSTPDTHGCSSKILQILSKIKKILTDSVVEKIIVFSEWKSHLEHLKDVLLKNSIRSILITSQSHFHIHMPHFTDPNNVELRILLLPIKVGSSGLNITQANHIIFMEPNLSPSLVYQAIGRCRRIGQTRPVYVYNFIMKNSIEEAIHQRFHSNTGSLSGDVDKKIKDPNESMKFYLDYLQSDS